MEPIEMDAEFDYTLYSSCKTATFINDINWEGLTKPTNFVFKIALLCALMARMGRNLATALLMQQFLLYI
jgi:hypothetical protein